MPTMPQPEWAHAETPLDVEAVVRVTAYRVVLTADQANALYNDIYRITNDAGIASASQRDGHFPALFSLYDALYLAGCDGAS